MNASVSHASDLREELPTIKLNPYNDARSSRPSLAFAPTTRTLPHEDCFIRVGRYSERDMVSMASPTCPSFAPVGFKSKVVSRRHCELWCSQGQWYIRDVKSSSGTFLNHIRLSQPNVESRPFPVNDGDIVQLGIDFRGGDEMIYRCVKIRIECNRGWQKTLNNYNVSTHRHLQNLGKKGVKKDSDSASTHSSQECSICLMSIAPCQCLFVAPCSHVWHYRCIRPILNDHRTYPHFCCPNCRAVTDLEAELEDPLTGWNGAEGRHDPNENQAADSTQFLPGSPSSQNPPITATMFAEASSFMTSQQPGDNLQNPASLTNLTPNEHVSTEPDRSLTSPSGGRHMNEEPHNATSASPEGNPETLPLSQISIADIELERANARTPMADMLFRECPATPTNSAGPFVFDGNAGRIEGLNAEPE